MGFCIYCNKNVYNNTTCPKCYRTIPVSNNTATKNNETSRVTAMFPNQKRLNQTNTDKWQDTYSKKAIFNNGLESAAPIRPRPQRVMPQFNAETNQQTPQLDKKKCSICQGGNFTSVRGSSNSSIFFCDSCRKTPRYSPTPESSSTSTPVLSTLGTSQSTLTSSANKTNAYFQFQRNRRTSMFNRSNLLEEEGQGSIRGSAPVSTVSTSAITVSPVGSPPTSPILDRMTQELNAKSSFSYKRERKVPSPHHRSSIHIALESTKSTPNLPEITKKTLSVTETTESSALIAPKATKSTTPIASKATETTTPITPKATEATSPIAPIATKSNSPPTPKTTETTPRKKRVIKKPCKECGQHVSKKDYRGLKIHTGEIVCFHNYCLFCAKCNENFNGLDFCTDGTKFYHTQCPDATTILKNRHAITHTRHDSPLSEEEDAYPRTPPSHKTHFGILSSTQDIESSLPYTEDDLLKKKDVVIPDFTSTAAVTCNTCAKPVTDSTCLELSNQFYHKECLLCAGCNKTVPTDRRLSKFQDKLYCDHCTPTNKKKAAAITNGLRINIENKDAPKRVPTITTPSDIFKSRKKVLPVLGGVRTCARCNQSMPFSDTQPGPGASRWHKNCLRCTGCKKQMDSDAHMTTNENTGLCLVHCRECLDETPKPRFVR